MAQQEMEQEERTIAPDGRPQSLQPDWRREFPIDVPEDDYVARREFTRFMGLTSLAFVVGQFWIAVASWYRARQPRPEPKPIARLADLAAKGDALTFTYPEESDTCLIVRVGDGSDEKAFRAYDQKCTHLSCAVVPEAEKNCLQCPCHHGTFDLETGRPIAGPPRRPLPRIELEVRDGTIYATRVELRTV
jgi:Rieske Fe-S protein